MARILKRKKRVFMKRKKRVRRVIKRGPRILLPELTENKYRSINLYNGLSVLLVSSSAVENVAALSVKCGSIYDPPNMQGLAHLLEHVLFLGSDEFPGLNEFHDFVNIHGGQVFGKTEVDHSIFSFQVDQNQFELALKMFADMVSSPSMDSDLIQKEVDTIESEFNLSKYRDSSRLEQLIYHTSSNDHPFHGFPWGNKQSFSMCDHQSLLDGLKNLFNDCFTTLNMKLVLIGIEELDVLERMALTCFSELKRGIKRGVPSSLHDSELKNNIWDAGKSYLLESLEGSQRIQISWVFPPTQLEARPDRYIANLLSQEEEGSLSFFLRQKGWITSFVVLAGNDLLFGASDQANSLNSTPFCQLFVIQMDITDSGWEKKYELVSYIYQYLNLLRSKGHSVSLVNEYETTLAMKYQSIDFDDLYVVSEKRQYAEILAVNMLKAPVSYAVCQDYTYNFGSEEELQDTFKYFSPENMSIYFLSKPFGDGDFEIEPKFESKYKVDKIPAYYMNKWRKWQDTCVSDPSLSLPPSNPFMPSQFFNCLRNLYDDDSFHLILNEKPKKLFHQSRRGDLLSSFSFNIYFNLGQVSKEKRILQLIIQMVNKELEGIMHKGNEAYINTMSICGDYNSLELRFYGFDEKLRDFVRSIWNKIRSFVPNEESFKMVMESKSTTLVQQALELLSVAVVGDLHLDEPVVSFEDVENFRFSNTEMRIVGVCFGRISVIEAIEILNLFDATGVFDIPMEVSRKIPLGKFLRVKVKPEIQFESNSLALVYFQVTEENENDLGMKRVLLSLFKAMVADKFYSELRYDQRLGYEISCGVHSKSDVCGFYFYVVSANHHFNVLLKRIESFVDSIGHFLENVEDDEFETYRRKTHIPDDSGISHHLVNDVKRIEGCAVEVGDLLQHVEKDELSSFYDKFFKDESSRRGIVVSISNED